MNSAKMILTAGAFLAAAVMLPGQSFETHRIPLKAGQRQATVVVPLQGQSRLRVQVWLHYSENQTELNSPSVVPRGRASCRSIANDRLKCSFIFPHPAHPAPNILTAAEMSGGEPPDDRPTFADFIASQGLLGPQQYFLADSNARIILPGAQVFYRWVKIVTGSGGSTTNDTIRSFEMPRLFTVANIGESFASGEGAPNRDLVRTPLTLNGALDDGTDNIFADEPMWEDRPCHRSEENGQSRAVRKIIRDVPGMAIRFGDFACSGATINNGLIGDQSVNPNIVLDPANRRTPSGPEVITSQLQRLSTFVGVSRKVDVILLSIGGNDAGFGTVARRCLIDNIAGECSVDPQVTNTIATGLNQLPDRLDDLRANLQARNIDFDHVVQFGYPDPTRDSAGAFCSPLVPITQTCWGVIERSVSQADFRFIHDSYIAPLNTVLSNFASQTPSWEFVPTAAMTRTRGLCNCSSGYFNTFGQSDFIQGDLLGSVHPNRTGHREVYQPLSDDKIRRRMARNAAIGEIRQRE